MKKSRGADNRNGHTVMPRLPPRGGSLAALLKADFQVHGVDVIEIVRIEDPSFYLRLIGEHLPLEAGLAAIEIEDIGDEELVAIIRGLRADVAASLPDGIGAGRPQERDRAGELSPLSEAGGVPRGRRGES
jgi:hypothetical protein